MNDERASPERLGSFEILDVLGEGGSAIVYAARDGDREVALKVLREDVGLDAREVDRFLDEADAMRKVQHRALVTVLRAGLLPGGRPYIAMPRLRGKTLAQRLHGDPIPAPRALALFEDVAAAVAALHAAQLIHRDIKPENVFWLEVEDRLVLLDLGIARDTSGVPSTTTRAGMMRGTPAYMAPERFFGKSATIVSDVYELALLLYAMLTAKLPWEEGDARGRIEPAPPSAHGIDLPAPLNALLVAALSMDPAKRPPTVDALREGIRDAMAFGHAPTELSPITPGAQVIATSRSPTARSGPPPETTTARSAVSGNEPVNGASMPVALATTTTTPRAGGGWLLAIGAGIALAGVAGGAFVVSKMGANTGPATQANAVETPPVTATAQQTAIATARPSASLDDDLAASASVSADAATPSATASASAAQRASSSATSSAKSGPTSAASSSSSPSAATSKPGGAMPAPCAQLIALMCSPTSGARPEECTAWKGNVASWQQKLPEAVVAESCQSAFTNSKAGLEHRKNWKPPPPPP